jgi:hypothetical protein
MANEIEKHLDLIDFYLDLEEDPELTGKNVKIFRRILSKYFFAKETDASKNIDLFINNLPAPDFIENADSFFSVDIDALTQWITGPMFKESLTGKIFLSPKYLKYYYPHHPSEYGKLPPNVQVEITDKIKQKNEEIINAFRKMMADKVADKHRTVLVLLAMIVKNIHRKTELPLNKLEKRADDTLKGIFNFCDEVFTASQKQVAELSDDNKIKNCIKTFYNVRTFQDMNGIAKQFKEELNRMKRRTIRARS